MTVRVRFAPSPTGHLHIGSARTALFNYLFAKKHNGTYILRIEDTDTARNKENAEAKFIEGFRWLGLLWDEGPDVGGDYGPYRSMERLHFYHQYKEQLLAENKAYRCYCTKEQLDQDREAMIEKGQIPRYTGRCMNLTNEEKEKLDQQQTPFTIRFRVPQGVTLSFRDLVRGDVSFESGDIEDFVIIKSDEVPTYHFAVTVDDALMRISHVIRGEEHLSNTPKHLLLFQALGFDAPEFAHIPLILNETGKKLSKRDESILQFIEQYRDLGYFPEAVVNFLALLGWSPEGEQSEEEIFSLKQLESMFSLERVNKSGAIFDPQKLSWLNSQYIKKSNVDDLTEMVKPFIKQNSALNEYIHLHSDPDQRSKELVELFHTAMSSLHEITALSRIFTNNQLELSSEAKEILAQSNTNEVLSAFHTHLVNLEDYSTVQIKKVLKDIQKETGYKGKQLFMPIRVAATGDVHGPDLSQTLYLLGKERIINRIQSLL